jgi:hypothetical protein
MTKYLFTAAFMLLLSVANAQDINAIKTYALTGQNQKG